MIYIREAHPIGPRQAKANERDKVLFEDPQTLAEREEVARTFAAQFKVSMPILVDTLDNKIEQAYTAMPDRIYVIDAQGKIAYKGDPGPSGFHAGAVPPVLDRLLTPSKQP